MTKRFFAAGKKRIGGSDAGNYFYSRDHLGSIREVTDSTGALKAQYDYDAWGNSVVVSGNMNVDFGFTGHYFHQPSGLNLSLYHAYNPNLGRWISRDPIGETGGVNLYAYVSNDVNNFWDPLGLLVEVYYERFSSGWNVRRGIASIVALHSFVHVQIPGQVDVTLELEGPRDFVEHGNPAIREFDSGRAQRASGSSSVTKPCPNDDYSYEYAVLEDFGQFYDHPELLPNYDPWSQNSNTFANGLIQRSGGFIDTPTIRAIGSSNAFTGGGAQIHLQVQDPKTTAINTWP